MSYSMWRELSDFAVSLILLEDLTPFLSPFAELSPLFCNCDILWHHLVSSSWTLWRFSHKEGTRKFKGWGWTFPVQHFFFSSLSKVVSLWTLSPLSFTLDRVDICTELTSKMKFSYVFNVNIHLGPRHRAVVWAEMLRLPAGSTVRYSQAN